MYSNRIKGCRFLNTFLKHTVGRYLRYLFNIESKNQQALKLSPPYLIIANHTNFWDPFFVSMFVPHHIHFVTSDEYFRNIILRFLLKLVGAIPKTKFMSDSETVKSIIKVKRNNGVIGIFPEGKRNWDGKTVELLYPTAKLIKSLNIPVVAALLQGAYLSYPRWASKPRRGKLTVSYEVILDPKTISSLTVDEVYSVISESLAYNEYEVQKTLMVPYRGKKLAEHLELFLFTCPQCQKIGYLKSQNNNLKCTNCSFSVIYNEYGFFSKADSSYPSFNTPSDWDKWQIENLEKKITGVSKQMSSQVILKDSAVFLKRGGRLRPLKKFRFGYIELFKDRLMFTSLLGEKFCFYTDKISGINVQYNNQFEFYYEKRLYRFTFKFRTISAYKWVKAVQIIKAPEQSALHSTTP